MSGSLFAVQETLYAALAADTAMRALIGNPTRLYDVVPPGAIYPYVTLGEMTAREFDTKDQTGFEQNVTFHIWSRYRGRKELKEIMQAIHTLLHTASLSVTGANFVNCRMISAATNLEADGLTLHGVMRYRIVVQH